MKVLIAIDASATSSAIINDIATRKWPSDAALCLLYVVKPMSLSSNFVDVESYAVSENEAAVDMVTVFARALQLRNIRAFAAIKKGNPGKVIVDYAKQWGADEIILGASHRTRLAAFFLGSTAQDVLRHAPCSVEIIRPTATETKKPDGEMRVLLATDGSPCSMAAARAVAAHKWPPQTRIKVVSAIRESVAAIEPVSGFPFIGTDFTKLEFLVEPIQGAISSTIKVIEDAGLDASEELLFGNPQEVISEHARDWGADLLVVGSHGKHGLERIFEGSVSEALAMKAPCNVLVAHEEPHV